MSINDHAIITIGMPVYNGEQHIEAAINSLLLQSEKRFWLEISDNCSTDRTYEICASLAGRDKRIRLSKNAVNMGPLYNFLKVIANAETEYFMWAAHDDCWEFDWIEKLISVHDDFTGVSFGTVVNITSNGEKLRTYEPTCFQNRSFSSSIKYYMEEDTKGKANIIYGIYKTKELQKLAVDFLGKQAYADDMLFVYTMLQNYNISINRDAVMYKRILETSKKEITVFVILKRLFLLDRVNTYLAYIKRSRGLVLKTAVLLLFPCKYAVSMVVNLQKIFVRFLNITH